MSKSTPTKVAPPGLKGLIVADTHIGSVRGDEGFFHYRQFSAPELAAAHRFEDIVRLLVDGRLSPEDSALPDNSALPNNSALHEGDDITEALAAARTLEPDLLRAIDALAPRLQPMTGLRVVLPLVVSDVPSMDLPAEQRREQALKLIGATPAILAAWHRRRHGEMVVEADPKLGHAADYLRMLRSETPAPKAAQAVETYLCLTADHGFNASTFTGRVVTSTGASLGGALCSSLAALSGPLHGGAPSRVLDMIEAIGDPKNTEAHAAALLKRGQKLMGFGHAVYRSGDPRSALLKERALGLASLDPTGLIERSVAIEARLLAYLRRIKPNATLVTNVEYYAAVVLHLAGIPQSMFTPTFATSRMAGWAAHVLEQAGDNKIMRPSARYVGPAIQPLSGTAPSPSESERA